MKSLKSNRQKFSNNTQGHVIYEQFPSTNFTTTIQQANRTLNDIATGKEAGEKYQALKQALKQYACDRHGRYALPSIDTMRDFQRVIAVLIQERNSANQTNNDILQLLIDNHKAFNLIEKIIDSIVKDGHNLAYQKLLELYYSRYEMFETHHNQEFTLSIKTHLLASLRHYDGKNKRTLTAKSKPQIVEGKLDNLLSSYPKKTTLEEIKYDLSLQDNHEIWHKIKIVRLLGTVRQWKANEYNKDVAEILTEVLNHKDTYVGSRNLLEEVTFITLDKCKHINHIDNTWINWILQHVGDPRNSKNEMKWHRISQELFIWLRSKLSQGDVKEFLETMTDGQGDRIYQYRRKFWLQYIEYVQYAKIMLNTKEYHKLTQRNKELAQRFKDSPETYSQLDDREQRSCIYIDFGNFKVIEGTHNAKVRLYDENPIKLERKTYEYRDFYDPKIEYLILDEYTHTSSENYIWQNKVRLLINNKLLCRIPLESMILEDDKANRLQEIQDKFFTRNESIY